MLSIAKISLLAVRESYATIGKNEGGGTVEKQRKALLTGCVALAAALLALLAVAWLLPSPEVPPVPTDPPGPTLPPNPYTQEDFRMEDGFMTCLAGETAAGVDVSSHQGIVDWKQVKAAGISFAIIRLGYRGYETGQLHIDPYALANLQGATDAGLQVGAYFYSQATSVEEAENEAALALSVLDGFPLALPVAYDWEYVSDSARTANMDPETLLDCTLAFCQAVEKGGYEAMVYFNPSLARNLLDLIPLQEAGYPFWLAYYTLEMDYPHRVSLWQYSDQGTVPGITGRVDLNLLFYYQ